MALAQDIFEITPDGATAHDGVTHRPSRPSRLRKVAEKATGDEAQLARMVRELHDLEDEITSKLTAADRVLAQLATRRTHEDGGYNSWAGFEERMLASAPVLRAMRDATSVPTPALGATPAANKRDTLDARGRQTKALTAMARALERLRCLEAELHECASHAAGKLSTIEGMRVYEECGYASYEEFLERALGPSPVLASAVALIVTEQLDPKASPPAPPVEPAAAEDGADGPAFPPALFDEGPAGSGTALIPTEASIAPTQDESSEVPKAGSSDRVESPVSLRHGRASRVVSVVLCCVGIIAGAAAGVGSAVASGPHEPALPSGASSGSVGMVQHAPRKEASDVRPAVPVVKGTPPAGLPVTH